MARADLDKQPGDVAAMFDAIAGRYDLLNDILSAGQVRLWRRAVARIIGVGPGERVLDLAAGTGTSSLTFTATGAECVACDFSLGMLQAGRARLAGPRGVRGGGQLLPREVRGDGSPRETELRGRRRAAAAVPRRGVRRGDDLVRAAERGRPGCGPGRDAPGDPAGRPAGGVRVQHDHDWPGRYALPALSNQCPARDRPADGPQPGSLRVPGRVDHGLARPA